MWIVVDSNIYYMFVKNPTKPLLNCANASRDAKGDKGKTSRALASSCRLSRDTTQSSTFTWLSLYTLTLLCVSGLRHDTSKEVLVTMASLMGVILSHQRVFACILP